MNRFLTCVLVAAGLTYSIGATAQTTYYFPPLTGNAWATTDPAALGWNTALIDELYDFLEERDSKAFIVLKDGRIVMERYFGSFTQDSAWYWASAGKSLTSFMVGMAQEQGFLNINTPTSTYLGAGWTSATPGQEAAITVRNQLTMTSGLDDGVPNKDCTDPACLQYLAAPGTRWAYHNAPYTLLDEVLEAATGQSLNPFFNSQIRNRTGMTGLWVQIDYNNVFVSKPRTMARYGSLILNRGVWNGDTLLHDQAYFTAMTTPSQTLNPAYGYLWWLNGQSSFRLPGVQLSIPGMLIPTAPADMYCALGKNDQKLYVAPSQNLVVVRMGNPAGDDLSLVPITFDRELWERLSAIMAGPTATDAPAEAAAELTVFPSPARQLLNVRYQGGEEVAYLQLWNGQGSVVKTQPMAPAFSIEDLAPGVYFLTAHAANGRQLARRAWVKH